MNMPVRLPISNSPRRSDPWSGPHAVIAGVLILALTVMAVSAWTLPAPLVLPVLSVLLIAAACLTALLAWVRPHNRWDERVTYWDITGALTLVGICAALLSEPDQVMPLLESRRTE
jgi:cobalamin synthase